MLFLKLLSFPSCSIQVGAPHVITIQTVDVPNVALNTLTSSSFRYIKDFLNASQQQH